MTSNPLCLDTNYLVGLFDEADLWHNNARAIHSLLQEHQIPIAYLDCVLNEVFTVLGRRCRERGISHTFPTLIDQVIQAIPDTAITWLYPLLPHWYSRCLAVIWSITSGVVKWKANLSLPAV